LPDVGVCRLKGDVIVQTRTQIAIAVGLMVNAVLFGAGAVAVLSIPALKAHAMVLLPAVIVLALALTPPIAWMIAPRLRLRHAQDHGEPDRA
jgi:hypothetical protein